MQPIKFRGKPVVTVYDEYSGDVLFHKDRFVWRRKKNYEIV